MLGAAHACANPLTARYDIAHGVALAMVLPHVVRWNEEFAADRYRLLLAGSASAAPASTAADTLARTLEALARGAGLKTRLSEAGVEEASLPTLASLAAQQWTGTFNPRPFDAEGALQIYKAAY
jgi:alcohol dehydrogenase